MSAPNLSRLKTRLHESERNLELAESKLEDERLLLKKSRKQLSAAKEAQETIQNAAASLQQVAHDRVAGIVSRCLRAVFVGESLEFQIVFERKRGKTEARMVFLEGGKEIDPREGAAGGALDVASLALRVAKVLMDRPPLRRTIVLDEPMKHLSSEYRPYAVSLLERLSEEFDIQFIMVTHSSDFEIGKVIRLP
jgi:DNA repair exonuclease SbcCD ATPase subunit